MGGLCLPLTTPHTAQPLFFCTPPCLHLISPQAMQPLGPFALCPGSAETQDPYVAPRTTLLFLSHTRFSDRHRASAWAAPSAHFSFLRRLHTWLVPSLRPVWNFPCHLHALLCWIFLSFTCYLTYRTFNVLGVRSSILNLLGSTLRGDSVSSLRLRVVPGIC